MEAESIPDIEQVLADLKLNQFPPHIAELPVKDKIKRAFTLYELYGVTQPYGLVSSLPNDIAGRVNALGFKQRYAFLTLLRPNIWWCLFFGPLYYFAAGMWRKGLILLCWVFFLTYLIDALFTFFAGTKLPSMGPIAVGLGYAVSMVAPYDLYRRKIKKEKFWW